MGLLLCSKKKVFLSCSKIHFIWKEKHVYVPETIQKNYFKKENKKLITANDWKNMIGIFIKYLSLLFQNYFFSFMFVLHILPQSFNSPDFFSACSSLVPFGAVMRVQNPWERGWMWSGAWEEKNEEKETQFLKNVLSHIGT